MHSACAAKSGTRRQSCRHRQGRNHHENPAHSPRGCAAPHRHSTLRPIGDALPAPTWTPDAAHPHHRHVSRRPRPRARCYPSPPPPWPSPAPHLDCVVRAPAGQHVAELPVPRQPQHAVLVAVRQQLHLGRLLLLFLGVVVWDRRCVDRPLCRKWANKVMVARWGLVQGRWPLQPGGIARTPTEGTASPTNTNQLGMCSYVGQLPWGSRSLQSSRPNTRLEPTASCPAALVAAEHAVLCAMEPHALETPVRRSRAVTTPPRPHRTCPCSSSPA